MGFQAVFEYLDELANVKYKMRIKMNKLLFVSEDWYLGEGQHCLGIVPSSIFTCLLEAGQELLNCMYCDLDLAAEYHFYSMNHDEFGMDEVVLTVPTGQLYELGIKACTLDEIAYRYQIDPAQMVMPLLDFMFALDVDWCEGNVGADLEPAYQAAANYFRVSVPEGLSAV